MSHFQRERQLRDRYRQADLYFAKELGDTKPTDCSPASKDVLTSPDYFDMLHPPSPQATVERQRLAQLVRLSTQISRTYVLNRFLAPIGMEANNLMVLPDQTREVKFDAAEVTFPDEMESALKEVISEEELAQVYALGKRNALAYTEALLQDKIPLVDWKRALLQPKLKELGIPPRSEALAVNETVLVVPTNIIGVDLAYHYIGRSQHPIRSLEIKKISLFSDAGYLRGFDQLIGPPETPASD